MVSGVRGEIRQLGQLEEVKQVQKTKRKYTVENGPLVKIREAFQKRLNLSENEYLSDSPTRSGTRLRRR